MGREAGGQVGREGKWGGREVGGQVGREGGERASRGGRAAGEARADGRERVCERVSVRESV